MANKFLVSVADAIMRDPNTGNALAYGIANLNSGLTISTSETQVRGGINNPLLYTYIHDRQVEVSIEQPTFDKNILAFNAGQSIINGAVNVTQTDCLVLSASGSGTLTATPIGDVSVILPDDTIEVVTPATLNITTSGGANQRVTAVYITSVTADQITIETTTPPSVVDLTLIAEVRDNTGVIVEKLQINIPRFQVDGNYTLSMTSNGVSSQTINGKSLAVASADCTTGEYYAKATWVPVSSSVSYSSIAAIPSTITFAVGSTLQNQQISVLGIRGGTYANVNITDQCTFARSGSTVGNITCGSATGLVSSGSAITSSHTALVTVTYASGSLIDYVTVNAA
jgi:hypothetical protein